MSNLNESFGADSDLNKTTISRKRRVVKKVKVKKRRRIGDVTMDESIIEEPTSSLNNIISQKVDIGNDGKASEAESTEPLVSGMSSELKFINTSAKPPLTENQRRK